MDVYITPELFFYHLIRCLFYSWKIRLDRFFPFNLRDHTLKHFTFFKCFLFRSFLEFAWFEACTSRYEFADDGEYYLGLTYTTLNKVDKAMDILSRFAEKYPQSTLKSNIYITLGGLYYRAEKRDLAVGSFKKAVESASDPDTRKLALANLIILYRDLGLWDGALSMARTYVEEFPDAEDIIDKKIQPQCLFLEKS